MGEYRREDDVCVFISLSIITTLNSTHARQQFPLLQADTAVYSRPLTLCTRLTPTTRCAHNTRHTQDTSHPVQTAASASAGAAITTLLAPRPHLTFLSLDRRGGRLRLSQPSRIPSRTNNSTHTPHGSGKKTPSKQHSTCCKHPAAAAAATAAHLTAHTKPRLSSTGTYLIVYVTSRRRVDHLRHARAQSEARLLRLG